MKREQFKPMAAGAGGGHQAQRGVHAPILDASEAAIIAARISSSSTAVYGSTGASTAGFGSAFMAGSDYGGAREF
jgi:hypothetical protein